jgi:IS5 family transposase
MKTPSPNRRQGLLFRGDLLEHLNPRHELLMLGQKIPWELLEKELEFLYSENGRPAKHVRLMCGLLILKALKNLSDENVVKAWLENPYFHAFCGERTFQWEFPCAASDLSHFRKRIGAEGAEKIFKYSVLIHGPKVLEKGES